MKILWIKTDFLHPTTGGSRIRTLAILSRLHRAHEVHYVAFDDPASPEGRERAGEYSAHRYAIRHFVPKKPSLGFAAQLGAGLVSPLPVAVSRYRSARMQAKIEELTSGVRFDAIVCDFLFPSVNVPDLRGTILFQHNVEAMIWKRHTEQAPTRLRRLYLGLQHRRMEAFERDVCRRVRRVIAVSPGDAAIFAHDYGSLDVHSIPTGVDVAFFGAPAPQAAAADILFLGTMDWLPNIDGVRWFVTDVLPLIHNRRPETTVAVVGRNPAREIINLATRDSRITVTGTVPDVRPWLRSAALSVVPLRIGGGTRLKIYEAMAARVPVVSTSIGAEGLDIENGTTIRIADTATDFADVCVQLLHDAGERSRLADNAYTLVSTKYSWDAIAEAFARLLM